MRRGQRRPRGFMKWKEVYVCRQSALLRWRHWHGPGDLRPSWRIDTDIWLTERKRSRRAGDLPRILYLAPVRYGASLMHLSPGGPDSISNLAPWMTEAYVVRGWQERISDLRCFSVTFSVALSQVLLLDHAGASSYDLQTDSTANYMCLVWLLLYARQCHQPLIEVSHKLHTRIRESYVNVSPSPNVWHTSGTEHQRVTQYDIKQVYSRKWHSQNLQLWYIRLQG